MPDPFFRADPGMRSRQGKLLAERHSLRWFPMGQRSVEEAVASELEQYATTGVTPQMLRDASHCCAWCARATVSRGVLTFSGNLGGKTRPVSSFGSLFPQR